MKITADTNLLLRVFLVDDAAQTETAIDLFEKAERVAIGLVALCEVSRVLLRSYEVPRADLTEAIRALLETRNVAVDRPGVEAGLTALEAGGDFADGVIAHQGLWLGGETFASFDKQAVRVVKEAGLSARLLA